MALCCLILVSGFSTDCDCERALAASNGPGYGGVEFFGSSQITRIELEKILSLKPGASLASIEKSVERLNKQLEARHISSNVEVVQGDGGNVFIAVDVLDSSVDNIPVRNLRSPRHVLVKSEKPFAILQQLNDRLTALSNEGRPWTESYRDGAKYYSDEVANQCVDQIQRFVPTMVAELLAVVDSDPDPRRRKGAVELLGWAGDIPDIGARLLPAFDDSDAAVRASAIKYFYPRLSYLPEEFPFNRLIDGASRDLNRPSHQDRSKSLYLLLALAKKNLIFIRQIKDQNEARVKQLYSDSVLPTIKTPASQLLAIFAKWDKGPLG